MSVPRTSRWRIALLLAGVAMALGGSMHPESDASDSLRDELATMTSDDAWVASHALLAVGTALLAGGLWSAWRRRAWPPSTRRSLGVAAITMIAYVVETLFHLAAVVDSDALAEGDAAPVAFAHVGLALVLYPISGVAFAWMNRRLTSAVHGATKVIGVAGMVAGTLHAVSVPLTIVFPDAEVSPVFAAAGMLFALWSLALGAFGLGSASLAGDTPSSDRSVAHDAAERYRGAETRYWASLGAQPTERRVRLPRLDVDVRVQEFGAGEPVVFVHGAPNAGTTWAPLVAELPGLRSIVIDRPGAGLSDPVAIGPDTLQDFGDHLLVDVLDALELERAHVVASSFGGFLSLRSVAAFPDRFGRMVQMGCPAGAPGMSVPSFMRASAIAPIRRIITALPPNERAAWSMLRQIGHGASIDAGTFSPEFMEWYLALQRDTPTMRHDLGMLASLVPARGDVHPALQLDEELLASVATPTWFHWGADDPFGGADVGRALTALIPGAAIEIVPRAGHLPWLDDPARAALSVRCFLEAGATPLAAGTSDGSRLG